MWEKLTSDVLQRFKQGQVKIEEPDGSVAVCNLYTLYVGTGGLFGVRRARVQRMGQGAWAYDASDGIFILTEAQCKEIVVGETAIQLACHYGGRLTFLVPGHPDSMMIAAN